MGTSFPLARALKRAVPKADVVHVHALYLFHTWAAARLCKRFGVPYLLRPHGTLDPFIWRRHRARKAVLEWLVQNRGLRDAAAGDHTACDALGVGRPPIHGCPRVGGPPG